MMESGQLLAIHFQYYNFFNFLYSSEDAKFPVTTKRNVMLKPFMIGLVVVAGLTACSTPKSYFTPEIRNTLQNARVDLKKVQFYVDRDIELKRQVNGRNATVSGGEIKLEDGNYIHVITLKKGTPGVVTRANRNSVDVTFEMGEGKYLTFGEVKTNPNEPYSLYADSWLDGLGALKYNGSTYYILPSSAGAKLMVKKKAVGKTTTQKTYMSGRKV